MKTSWISSGASHFKLKAMGKHRSTQTETCVVAKTATAPGEKKRPPAAAEDAAKR